MASIVKETGQGLMATYAWPTYTRRKSVQNILSPNSDTIHDPHQQAQQRLVGQHPALMPGYEADQDKERQAYV